MQWTTTTSLTTIRRPSATSPRSRAALTRVRDLAVSSRRSRSLTARIQGSPTSESRIKVAREGGMTISDIKLESGFSIFWQRDESRDGHVDKEPVTRRLFSLCSISLLRSCNSNICPETTDRSFWNVERKDSNESSRETLVCSIAMSADSNAPSVDLLGLGRAVRRILWLSRGLPDNQK